MTIVTENLTLGNLSLTPILRPRPDIMAYFGCAIDVVEFKPIIAATPNTMLTPKESSAAISTPFALIFTLCLSL
jgi:hypothetical protein